jgi:hypothetical protein
MRLQSRLYPAGASRLVAPTLAYENESVSCFASSRSRVARFGLRHRNTRRYYRTVNPT